MSVARAHAQQVEAGLVHQAESKIPAPLHTLLLHNTALSSHKYISLGNQRAGKSTAQADLDQHVATWVVQGVLFALVVLHKGAGKAKKAKLPCLPK